MYSFQGIMAVAEKGVNYSSHPLWMGLYLKQGNLMLNVKKKKKLSGNNSCKPGSSFTRTSYESPFTGGFRELFLQVSV